LRVLIFEFITGGGFAAEQWPESLASEGAMMLQALVSELKRLPHIQVVIMLDWRCRKMDLLSQTESIVVQKNQNFSQILQETMAGCDAVWPIAPEMDFILLDIAKLAETLHKTAILSTPEAVKLCSNKLATIKCLQEHHINVCDTQLLSNVVAYPNVQSVIKPIDGVGCEQSFIISCQDHYQQVITAIDNSEKYIIQPFIKGQSLSLSCLFKEGKAWLLCCNEQQVLIAKGQFQLQLCAVNIPHHSHENYQKLLEKIAQAIPGLWGYIGIDIINTDMNGPVILEINPRLTTSYVGIHSATGINVAEQVIQLLTSDPVITRKDNRQVNVTISKGI